MAFHVDHLLVKLAVSRRELRVTVGEELDEPERRDEGERSDAMNGGGVGQVAAPQ